MNQRGITLDLVELTRTFGVSEQDKIILGKKQLGMLINAARELQKTALKALDKGGIVVVEADGAMITTYGADSYNRRKSRLKGRL
jgi:hypothetical protein